MLTGNKPELKSLKQQFDYMQGRLNIEQEKFEHEISTLINNLEMKEHTSIG